MTRINSTLLRRLFYEPNPQPRDPEVVKYFEDLKGRMFPNIEDYIEFLKAQSVDRQYESAERIIHRLCYHANFPPPYYALLDILCLERYQEKGILDSDKYIPRDHFIHIVYLYLLGIYVFFYNSEFYTKIINANRFERNGFFWGNEKYNCIKDFTSEWKYFCLYHDIGYSAEILGNTKKFPNRNKVQKELKREAQNYKASLGNGAILKQSTYFGSLEIISKLIFVRMVVSNSVEKIYPDHKIFRHYKQQRLSIYSTDKKKEQDIKFAEIPNTVISGVQLEKIYSNQCLKKILPTIDIEDLVIVGLEKSSGLVEFISYVENEARFFIFSDKLKANSEFKNLLQTPDMIIFDDYCPDNFEFLYILKDDNSMEERISSIVDPDFFDSTYFRAEKIFENDFKEISDESNFVDFSFVIYHWLLRRIKNRLDNTQLEKYLDLQTFSFQGKSQLEITKGLLSRRELIRKRILGSLDEYHQVLLQKCNALLNKKINEEFQKPKPCSSPDTLISQYVERYFQTISIILNRNLAKEIFHEELRESIFSKIEEEVNLLQLFSQVFIQLKSTLDKSESLFEYNYVSGKTTASSFLNDEISAKVQAKLGMPDIETVSEEYQLDYGNTSDHGIVSAQYAADVFSCYRNALLKAENKQEQLLLSILLDAPNGIIKSRVRYIDNYNHVFTETLFAVFIHNLYPDHFKGTSKGVEYKTKISDPFTYLSLLCDALQKWNRPRSLQPALFENHPLSGASEEYDIEINNNHILLSDIGTKDGQWFNDTISMLSTYLANIKAFLKYKQN